MNNQNNLKQKGVSLIITFFIMIIILAVVISISILLYSGIKVIRNMGNSVVAFYAADSGVEKVLYYDRQVKPLLDDGVTKAARGLCAMIDSNHNQNYCNDGGSSSTVINCNDAVSNAGETGTGCNYDVCDNCTITFNTNYKGKTYDVEAGVDTVDNYLKIKSRGVFNGVERRIETSVPLAGSEAPPPGGGGSSSCGGGYFSTITNHCWYVGASGESCTSVCSSKGLQTESSSCCEIDTNCEATNHLVDDCINDVCTCDDSICPAVYVVSSWWAGSCFSQQGCDEPCATSFPGIRRICACRAI